MTEREEFEKWVRTEMKGFAGGVELAPDLTDSDWDYFTKAAEVAWRAWQAARAHDGGEAVAWSWVSRGRHVTVDKSHAEELRADGELVVPLYTRPSSSVSDEELLKFIINFLFSTPRKDGKRFDFDGLRGALCRIGVVSEKDGHNLVRRSSVLEIVERFRPSSPVKGAE